METPEDVARTTAIVRKIIAEAFAQREHVMLLEAQEMLPLSIPQTTEITSQQQVGTTRDQSDEGGQANQEEQQDDSPQEGDARLERAYRELEAEGKRISGRALAARAHVRRSTCNQWLETYHPESIDGEEQAGGE